MKKTVNETLDELGAALKTTKGTKATTCNIFDGLRVRYDERRSITPKQAEWLIDQLRYQGIEIPEDLKPIIEIPGIPAQKEAYARVLEKLPAGPDINDRAVEDLLDTGHIIQDLEDSKSVKDSIYKQLDKMRKNILEIADQLERM